MIVTSYGLYPDLSEADSYRMAAFCIDTAIRNAVAAGADPKRIALLDNFCWCSPDDENRLYQLKNAAQACHDYAVSYQTPFISGKDSMYNDFQGYDKNGRPVKISIQPTLLITSIGIIENVYSAVTPDFKQAGDLLYLLGDTFNELLPYVDAAKNLRIYQTLHTAILNNLISSAVSVNKGGLAVALVKGSMAGKLGIKVQLSGIKGKVSKAMTAFFSESMGRIIVSITPENKKKFEDLFKGVAFSEIGVVSQNDGINLNFGPSSVNTTVKQTLSVYRNKFAGY
ncbi:MAG: phosphoribosylformylglycinamidine synthase II, phosphoribosylformylglycinamidine synthase [Candidatus Gottesmanbacteria bacterium GW2011_GWA2_43_14]|uniref:Phosphoribosylformylglycinamidine synthase II, phosphoribosylformylglycinamidine synthase n=1 Tax=Candidatus Gottesmanbacteria bacterium GW2011_GWA2_43_14 TaxID=1618443 RepID=A0A0G1DLF0_9BACT|nr:MAG: phosphoribosylformylglycinamidine synthase II, phosphoribosylformylglycinamidine synthase [Candidatus Gottesmanbacteria bacterium GW2011_GWA2_43_14]